MHEGRTFVWDICTLPCGNELVSVRNYISVHGKSQLIMLVSAKTD